MSSDKRNGSVCDASLSSLKDRVQPVHLWSKTVEDVSRQESVKRSSRGLSERQDTSPPDQTSVGGFSHFNSDCSTSRY